MPVGFSISWRTVELPLANMLAKLFQPFKFDLNLLHGLD
jgi:hypothetical protein